MRLTPEFGTRSSATWTPMAMVSPMDKSWAIPTACGLLETHQHAQRASLTQDWLAPNRIRNLSQAVASGPVIAVEPAQQGGALLMYQLAQVAAAIGAPHK